MFIPIVVVMKKVFTLLALCFLASVVWAGDVVFVAGVDNGDSPGTAAPFTIIKDGVTVTVSNGLANETQYRVYKSHSITICSQVGDISKIVFECIAEGDAQYGPACFVTDVGEYSCEGKIGVWIGCDPCVTFTAALNQVRITRITVTIGECGGLGAPIINPASGTYYEPIQVSMTSYTSGAVIHYTTDGSDPDEQSPVYTVPFTVDHDMTVKAVSVLDDEMSDVVSADYVFCTPLSSGCFEDLEPLDNGSVVRFTSPIYALSQHGNHLYAKDGCGGFGLIWGDTGQSYRTGDVIPAGFVVTKSFYAGEMELIQPSNFKPATSNITIEPEPLDPNQFGPDMFAHYVIFECVTISSEDGHNYVATDTCGNSIPLYFNMGVHVPSDLNKYYDIIGVIGSYSQVPVYQLLPTKIIMIPDPGDEDVGLGNYWKYIDPVNPPESITINLDATVILQAGSYLYAKDKTGYGLIYGNVGQTYKHGDVIPAGYGGKVTFYDGWPELIKPFIDFQPAKDHVMVEPELVTIPQIIINRELWAHYVMLVDVYVDKEKRVIRDRDGNELPIYIRPEVQFTYPEGWTRIRGIVSYFHDQPQLLVWDIDGPEPKPIHCLKDSNNLENPNDAFRVKLVVIYQNGASLYVQDLCEDFTLMYGAVDGNFVNGDTIEVVARFGSYHGQRQLIPGGDCRLIGHGPAVEPIDPGCTEEVSTDMCHWYVQFENVEIVEDDGKSYIEDECGRLLIYNKFDVYIPENFPYIVPRTLYDINNDGEVNIADINCLIDMILSGRIEHEWVPWRPDGSYWNTYDVSGFLNVYNNGLELYPVTIYSHGEYLIIGDTNLDGELNVADVNELIDVIIRN